ncbi:HRD1 [Sanghuangporus sanghuang]
MPTQLRHYASSIASYRVLLYTGLSVGAVFVVVANALKKHSNFYSVAVYLSKSNGAVVVLANFALLLALLAGRLLQQIFFGPLRAMEVERLYDRMWFFVTESLLAFTIFRDEFDIPFALMFGLLLFTKCFHWLLSDRIEWMDQRPYPGPPLLFHVRINALIWLLWATDLVVFLLTVENMLTYGVGGTVLFASEYAILLASLGNSVAKYAIALLDLRRASRRGGENAPPWEDKSMLVFYVELATDFVKLVTYMSFFMLVLTFYGLPLNIVRDVYITARSFIIRFRDLLRYRTATRNMDERYPNATEEELNNMSDRTCIICRDEMVHPSGTQEPEDSGGQAPAPRPQDGPNTTPKKLPCGHIFHFYCLRSWLERQQSCPTCRRSVLEENRPPQGNGQAAAPRVQPGVLPRAPNGPAPAEPLQWQPDQGANRGGIFGRIMGAAGVPPVGHGQFPPGPLPGQVQQPEDNGAAVRHGPHEFPQPLAYPRPFPTRGERFAGFFRPDGVWQAWPQGPGIDNNPLPNDQPIGALAPTRTTTVVRVEQSLNENRTDPTVNESGNVARTTSTAPSSSSAQEVAASAALRHQTRLDMNLPSGQSPRRDDSPRPASSEGRASNGREPNNNHSSSSRLSETGSALDSDRQTRAPTLIPLFDPHISSYPLFRTSQRPVPGRFGTNLPNAPFRLLDFPQQARQRSARELPPVLTDDQLRLFDQLTREAIDERLRILENVQQMTTRCVEDLLRCRSMLPRSTVASPASSTAPSGSTNDDGRTSSKGARSTSDESSATAENARIDNTQNSGPFGTGA